MLRVKARQDAGAGPADVSFRLRFWIGRCC